MNSKALEEQFKAEVSDRAAELDPGSSCDWYALTLGWAIAKGLTIDDAQDFACHIRYGTDLG